MTEREIWKPLAIGTTATCAVLLILLVLVHPPSSSPVVWSAQERRDLAEVVSQASLSNGTVAPDFSLATTDGDSQCLACRAGQPVALVFVSTSCGYCGELERRLAAVDPDRSTDILLISSGDLAAAQRLKSDHHVGFPVLVDSARTVSILYRVSVVPTVYLIDAQGKVQDSAHGLPDSWTMLQRVTG
ncbi:MAG: TlpA disulfide reductase family protein [Candidatus Latescibacterota bacterium]|jgi:peroxiredoxin